MSIKNNHYRPANKNYTHLTLFLTNCLYLTHIAKLVLNQLQGRELYLEICHSNISDKKQ